MLLILETIPTLLWLTTENILLTVLHCLNSWTISQPMFSLNFTTLTNSAAAKNPDGLITWTTQKTQKKTHTCTHGKDSPPKLFQKKPRNVLYVCTWEWVASSAIVAIDLHLQPVSSAIVVLLAIDLQLQNLCYLQLDCNYDDYAGFENLMPIFWSFGTQFAIRVR